MLTSIDFSFSRDASFGSTSAMRRTLLIESISVMLVERTLVVREVEGCGPNGLTV
jgi:hypothetical protein